MAYWNESGYGSQKVKELSFVFDKTCSFINFSEMMSVFEKFVNRLNELIDKKENEINHFLTFIENYNKEQ